MRAGRTTSQRRISFGDSLSKHVCDGGSGGRANASRAPRPSLPQVDATQAVSRHLARWSFGALPLPAQALLGKVEPR
jgi:hypothetical protein